MSYEFYLPYSIEQTFGDIVCEVRLQDLCSYVPEEDKFITSFDVLYFFDDTYITYSGWVDFYQDNWDYGCYEFVTDENGDELPRLPEWWCDIDSPDLLLDLIESAHPFIKEMFPESKE